jgi:hypothetical protein
MELNTDKYDLWECSECFRVVARDWYLASQLNSLTKYYPEGTVFQRYEEPVFKFPKRQLDKVLEILKS